MSNLTRVQKACIERQIDLQNPDFYNGFCDKLFEYYTENNTGLSEDENDSYITFLTFVIEDVLNDMDIPDEDCDQLIQFINSAF